MSVIDGRIGSLFGGVADGLGAALAERAGRILLRPRRVRLPHLPGGGALLPSEWRGFRDHGRVQDTLGQIRITPQSIVIFDAKYPVNSLPDGRRFGDMSVRLEGDPANMRAKYEQRTRRDYPDPAVQQAKLAAYDTVYAPSYQRFLGLQQQYALDRPGSSSAIAPDPILNVDLNHVPTR